MLDNIRIAMERQISRENSTVKSASVANRIKREGEKQGSKQNFKDEMNKKTLKNSGNTTSFRIIGIFLVFVVKYKQRFFNVVKKFLPHKYFLIKHLNLAKKSDFN